MPSLSTLVVLLSVAASTLGSHQLRNHNGLAKRVELNKRFFSPRITWYPTNTGPDACTGRNHGDYDNIVAMNMPQFGSNGKGVCGRKIRISANGKTAIGVVQDACASCPEVGQIDLTRGLFEKFTSLDKGVFTGTWEFVDGDDGDDSPPPKKTPKKTTHKETPKETPTPAKFVPPKTIKKTTTATPKKTHTRKSSTPSSTSTKKSSSVVQSSVPIYTPTSTPVTIPTGVGNVGADPSSSADAASVNGGIVSDGVGNGAASVTLNKFVAGAAAVLLVVQAL